MEEIWKDIKNYEGLYQISNLGRIRSLDRKIKNGNGYWIKKGKILKPQENSNGYLRIRLKGVNSSESKYYFIHRLVGECFLIKDKNKNIINHLDCNPKNNTYTNLEWTTIKGNYKYMQGLGRNKRTKEWKKNQKKALENIMGKKVKGVEISTGLFKIYNCLNDVKNDGFQPSCVSDCCNNKRNQHKGHYWGFVYEGNKKQ